jgi:S1-C subfamily serine protease
MIPRVRANLAGCGLAALAALVLAGPAAPEPCTEPFATLYERLAPSVVSIQATKINKARVERRFETAVGAGVVVDRDGQLLTSAHVVDGAASVTVTFQTGEKVSGRVLGLDPLLDIALLRADARTPPRVARLGDSSTLKVGEDVAAIGTPVGFDLTLTRGIVSGLDRILPGMPDQRMIQTDAAINPGNSGGPLVNRCGAVVGINTFLSEDAQRIGFAVPINAVKAILRDLREVGRVVRPWIGIQGRPVEPRLMSLLRMPLTPGYLAEIVHEDSPAERAGIRGGDLSVVIQGEEYLVGGDVVTAIQGQPVRSHDEYLARVNALRPGQKARVTVFRDGHTREVTVVVGERPRLPSDLAE